MFSAKSFQYNLSKFGFQTDPITIVFLLATFLANAHSLRLSSISVSSVYDLAQTYVVQPASFEIPVLTSISSAVALISNVCVPRRWVQKGGGGEPIVYVCCIQVCFFSPFVHLKPHGQIRISVSLHSFV